ncbi:hypothetical protein DSECCO2_283390 [anaerobic digester metagenome]
MKILNRGRFFSENVLDLGQPTKLNNLAPDTRSQLTAFRYGHTGNEEEIISREVQ